MILLPSLVSRPPQFTPGSHTTLRTRPPLTPSDREYTPARSAADRTSSCKGLGLLRHADLRDRFRQLDTL